MKIKNDILINILNILRNNHNSAIVLTTTKRKCNLQIYSRNLCFETSGERTQNIIILLNFQNPELS